MVKAILLHLQTRLGYLKSQDHDSKQKVITWYRYISWLLTSLFYLTDPPYDALKYRIIVILSLFIASRVIIDLYRKNSSPKAVQTIILVETIGLTLLLIPTGGLDSPFIWYALNPVLIAASYLKPIFCWLDLSFYLIASVAISWSVFNREGLPVTSIVERNSYIILAYILITIAMRLLIHLINYLGNQAATLKKQRAELMDINRQLQEANLRVKKSMEHIMSLYRIIEAFSAREETKNVLQKMVAFTVEILQTNSSFLKLIPNQDFPGWFIAQGVSAELKEEVAAYLASGLKLFNNERGVRDLYVKGLRYLILPVWTSSKLYGYLGIEIEQELNINEELSNQELLSFLSDLVAVVLERYHLEKTSAKLMIMEEQNRIANEIHDNVSQRLFSIVCAIHALNANGENLEAEEISKQLKLIEESAKEAGVELRTSIYRLSTRKRGEKAFRDNLQSYFNDFAALHGLKVFFNIYGDEERLPLVIKQAIYRIIREASGNAVKHGKCSVVTIELAIHNEICELLIKDNGQGFDVKSTLKEKENRGLGINNMQVLTQTFNGNFKIVSEQGAGTEINIKFPLDYLPGATINLERGGVA